MDPFYISALQNLYFNQRQQYIGYWQSDRFTCKVISTTLFSVTLHYSVFHDEKAQNNFVTLSIYNIFFHPAFCIVATASWVPCAEPFPLKNMY